MEVSFSKLLPRYQSRNGSWFAVNRKQKVKQERVNINDRLEETRTIRSETNPTCLLDLSETNAHYSKINTWAARG